MKGIQIDEVVQLYGEVLLQYYMHIYYGEYLEIIAFSGAMTFGQWVYRITTTILNITLHIDIRIALRHTCALYTNIYKSLDVKEFGTQLDLLLSYHQLHERYILHSIKKNKCCRLHFHVKIAPYRNIVIHLLLLNLLIKLECKQLVSLTNHQDVLNLVQSNIKCV